MIYNGHRLQDQRQTTTIIITRLYIYKVSWYSVKRDGTSTIGRSKTSHRERVGLYPSRTATIGLACGTEAKMKAAVDTGFMRNAGSLSRGSVCYVIKVTSPAGYSVYVELGTRKMKASRFLDPAVKEAKCYLKPS